MGSSRFLKAAGGAVEIEGSPLEAVSADSSASAARKENNTQFVNVLYTNIIQRRLTLDFASNEMGVQLGLGDQEVELSSLPLGLSLFLLPFRLLQRLLLRSLPVLTFVLLVSLPEHEHLQTKRAMLIIIFAGRLERQRHSPLEPSSSSATGRSCWLA